MISSRYDDIIEQARNRVERKLAEQLAKMGHPHGSYAIEFHMDREPARALIIITASTYVRSTRHSQYIQRELMSNAERPTFESKAPPKKVKQVINATFVDQPLRIKRNIIMEVS